MWKQIGTSARSVAALDVYIKTCSHEQGKMLRNTNPLSISFRLTVEALICVN